LNDSVAALTESGNLTVHSILTRSSLFSIAEVAEIHWIDVSILSSPVLITFAQNSPHLYSSASALPIAEAFDSNTRLARIN
jgi:hypothetical protein